MSDAPPEANPRRALAFLWGARVQRIDGPSPTLFALTLYEQGEKQSLIFALGPPRPELGLVLDRPSGNPASGFVRRMRVAIENARLVEAHWLGGGKEGVASALSLSFLRAGAQTERLIADFNPSQPNLYLVGADDAILGAADERTRRTRFPGAKQAFRASEHGGIDEVVTREAALQRGAAMVHSSARSADHALRTQATAQAKAALKRLSRKALAIREDVARADSAPLLRREANLLLCHLGSLKPGACEACLEDLACDPPEALSIQLDPALSALANAERRFARARRMERGATISRQRLAQTEAELEAMSRFADSIPSLDPSSLIDAAAALGIKLDAARSELRTSPTRKARQTHVPYRVFQGVGGARILVGKGAEDNDALTLTVARPHDLWLHARGLHGAHVLIPRERGRELSPELLLDAAHLAVHFSRARGEPGAEVQYAERRYVRKLKGSAPGAVRVDRERVVVLRMEAERLRRLLAAEVQP